MTSILKNVCIDKLDDIVNKYKNTCHSSIKMKLADLKSSTYIVHPRFEVGDNVGISKHKRIFAKGYAPNWSKEAFCD